MTTSRHHATRDTAPPGYTGHKPDHLARLHKIEGQTRGITRMVTNDRYCIDVLSSPSRPARTRASPRRPPPSAAPSPEPSRPPRTTACRSGPSPSASADPRTR
ncbi:metal-sensing transcriptional repressor [Streptomyces sparsogenes]|uniref:metal-sensing transcriptional repressor n=1 Tax=Streptomyces sparsogenes TaxID=67365 RepID=UPI0033D3C6F3